METKERLAPAARGMVRDMTAAVVRQNGRRRTPLKARTLNNVLSCRHSASARSLKVIADALRESSPRPPWSAEAHETAFEYLVPRLGSPDWCVGVRHLRFVQEIDVRPSVFCSEGDWGVLLVRFLITLGDVIDGPPAGIGHHVAGSLKAVAFVRACAHLKRALKSRGLGDRRHPAWFRLLSKLTSDGFFVGSWNKLPGEAPPRPRTPELLAEFEAEVEPVLRAYNALVPTNWRAPKNLLAVASYYGQSEKYADLLVLLARARAPGHPDPRPEDVDLSNLAEFDDDFEGVREWQRARRAAGGESRGPGLLCAALLALGTLCGGDLPSSFNGDVLAAGAEANRAPSFNRNGDLLMRRAHWVAGLNGDLLLTRVSA